MKIKYMGPSPSVNIGGHPAHIKGEIVEYAEDVAKDLLADKKQKFVQVKNKGKEVK